MKALGVISILMFVAVTVWSALRFLAARDSVAEVSAGVWWIGGMMFWGALVALAAIAMRRAEGEKGKQ